MILGGLSYQSKYMHQAAKLPDYVGGLLISPSLMLLTVRETGAKPDQQQQQQQPAK